MMKFQVFLLIMSCCYSAVVRAKAAIGNPPISLIAKVDTGWGSSLCSCPSGTPTTIIRPVPSPYIVEIEPDNPNGIGYYGVDAMHCPGSCPSPNFAKLQVHLSLSGGGSDVPDDDRLVVSTSPSSNFHMRRLQFKVKFAESAKIELFDSAGLGRGECVAFNLPVAPDPDNAWHQVRCNWCTVGIQQIRKLTIKFVQDINVNKNHIRVKQLKLWSCQ